MMIEVLIVLLFAVWASRFINYAIYTWAYNHRSLGPWAPPPTPENSTKKKRRGAKNEEHRLPAHTWVDHIPVLGWWQLRRESSVHGQGYWIRPMLIELLFPILALWYYTSYTGGGMHPSPPALSPLPTTELRWQAGGHLLLFTLMSIATFIDFDERSIPDLVTIPGVLLGLLGASIATAWLPFTLSATGALTELHGLRPGGWLKSLNGQTGLVIGLLIVFTWGFALLDRVWIVRRGYGKAIVYFFARMTRNRVHLAIVGGSVLIASAIVLYSWRFQNPGRWEFVLSALIGLAFAGGMTWAVRISGSLAMGMEALGFGDVTLMAMIGCYIGWQPSLLVFFIAPIVGLVFVLVRSLLTGDTATPYGPYLCMGVLVVLVFWHTVWTMWMQPRMAFIGAETILAMAAICIVLLGVILWILQLLKRLWATLVG